MDSREQRRAQLVPALAKITRARDFRASLSEAMDADSNLTIIPVLPDDRMEYMFARLHEADDRAVVAMPVGDQWDIATAWPASRARVTVAREDDSVAQIHSDSEVSMFFGYLMQRDTVVVEEIAARLMPRDNAQVT